MRQQNLRPQPEARPEAKQPGYISTWVFALCLVLGLAGGIAFTRYYGPWQRANAEPWQLHAEDRAHYMLAIALEYAHRGDLPTALDKLIALKPAGDPLAQLAEAACALGSRGYLASPAGVKALRSAVKLYSAQGRQGCAELLLPPPAEAAPAATVPAPKPDAPRATPLPTKKPLREQALATATPRFLPALPEARSFELLSTRSFCDLSRPALVEVFVVDYLGRGIPGQRIRARWGEQQDIFVSGLKAERGDAYADFQMDEGIEYAIDMENADGAQGASVSTGACYTDNRRGLKSYRVTFVER